MIKALVSFFLRKIWTGKVRITVLHELFKDQGGSEARFAANTRVVEDLVALEQPRTPSLVLYAHIKSGVQVQGGLEADCSTGCTVHSRDASSKSVHAG
jgi:hypothetical protein